MKLTPPWKTESEIIDHVDVRPDWESGLWNYALGKPAKKHKFYKDAV